MIIRETRPSDFADVIKLYDQRDIKPDFTHVASKIVAEEGGKIIGFGDVRTLLEATILIDTAVSKRRAVEATKKIIEVGVDTAKVLRYDSIHAFVTVENFEQILAKHFGFRPCKGKAFYLEV